MKSIIPRLFGRIFSLPSVCAVLAISLACSQPAFALSTINNGNNASVSFDFNSSAGMNSWLIDSVNQASQQSFWYRVGSSGPQLDLTTISAPIITMQGPRAVTAIYSNAQYEVKLSYTLSLGSVGSQKAQLAEAISLINTGTSDLDFHFFMYSDLVLGGASQIGTQNVLLGTTGGTSTSVQTFGSPGSNTVSVIGAASHTEAALYGQTYNNLTTVNGYTLDDSTTAGPGNATWAWEWDYTIGGGASKILSITDTINVPEPSALAFLLLGGGFMALKRRSWKL